MSCDHLCRECGAREIGSWLGEDSLKERGLCFSCGFWDDLLRIKDEPTTVRADGKHYVVGEPNERWPGFGGSRFVISFNDGREVETCNLWSQGDIPTRFKDRMPDNAKFVTGMGARSSATKAR